MFNDFKQKQFEFDCMSTMTDLIEEDFTYTRQDIIERARNLFVEAVEVGEYKSMRILLRVISEFRSATDEDFQKLQTLIKERNY